MAIQKFTTMVLLGALGIMMLFSACARSTASTPVTGYDDLGSIPETELPETSGGLPTDVIVYASDLTQADLSELDFYDDPLSPLGKLIGLPNNGDELDPPPENDPYVTFTAQVRSGIPYRCWIHMKVGAPKGVSDANVFWVQFLNSVDQSGNEVYRPKTKSFLTAQGTEQQGWQWVGCNANHSPSESLVYFDRDGETTVRLQAGAEGVGFDQFILSPEKYLTQPPLNAQLEK